MQFRTYILIIAHAVIAAMLFYAVQTEYIIIQWPQNIQHEASAQPCMQRCSLLYQKTDNSWHTVYTKILWHEADMQHNLQHLLNAWFTYAWHKQYICRHPHVQAVLQTFNNDDLYISCDAKPFTDQAPIHHKLQVINGICATIATITDASQAHLMVQHAAMQDPHIDGNHPLTLPSTNLRT